MPESCHVCKWIMKNLPRRHEHLSAAIVENLSNQALGACLRPERDSWSLQTYWGWCVSTYPGGCTMCASSLSTPWRKEFRTSSYLRGQLNWTTGENDSHCRWFDHRDKSLIKGHPILLVKPFSHQPSLVFTNIPIIVMFQLEDPLAANYILRWGRRN